jgi:hypothetical protein
MARSVLETAIVHTLSFWTLGLMPSMIARFHFFMSTVFGPPYAQLKTSETPELKSKQRPHIIMDVL